MQVIQVVYRELLSVAKQFDKHVALRALISSELIERANRYSNNQLPTHISAFNNCIMEYLNGKDYYLPPLGLHQETKSMVKILQEKFRIPLQSSVNANADGIDIAFHAIRVLHERIAYAKKHNIVFSCTEDHDEKQTILSSNGTDKIDVQAIEPLQMSPGMFLLSHPLLVSSFKRSVIVLTNNHSAESTGFIVNHVRKASLSKSFHSKPLVIEAFGANRVHSGGPMYTENAQILHTYPELGGMPVTTSNFPTKDNSDDNKQRKILYVGIDLPTAAHAVKEGRISPNEITFLTGYTSWNPGQLVKELKKGTWLLVKAPIELAVDASPDLWQVLMKQLGGEYAELSLMPPFPDHEDRQ